MSYAGQSCFRVRVQGAHDAVWGPIIAAVDAVEAAEKAHLALPDRVVSVLDTELLHPCSVHRAETYESDPITGPARIAYDIAQARAS